MAMNTLKVHRDPRIYGENADNFIPERMLDENFKRLPRNAWKVRVNPPINERPN